MSTNEMTGGEALARMLARPQGRADVRHGRVPAACRSTTPRAGSGSSTTSSTTSAPACSRPTPMPRCRAASAWPTRRSGRAPRTSSPGSSRRSTPARRWWCSSATATALHSWKNMTQESRQIEILRPACKELIRIERVERIPELMRRAFAVATSGRPGPVVVDVPEDICHGTLPFEDEDFAVDPRSRGGARRCAAGRTAPRRRAPRRCSPRPSARSSSPAAASTSAAPPTCSRPSRAPAHSGRAHHDRQGRDRLHRSAQRRPVRPLRPHRQRADRGSRLLLVVGCKLGEIATKRFTVPPKGKTLIHLDIVAEEFGRTTEPDRAVGRCPRRHRGFARGAAQAAPRGSRRIR